MKLSGWEEEASLIVDTFSFHLVIILSSGTGWVIEGSLSLKDILHLESD